MRSKLGSIPSTVLVLNESQPSDKRRIDCKILYAITGLYTFNSKLPEAPAKVMVVSLPITWVHNIVIASH